MVSATALKATLKTLPVVETFHSVQGEGYWTGVSAFFIRLAGCDVGCPWCDTKHSWPMDNHPVQTVEALVSAAVAAEPFMVVITGGEPLMHDLKPLTDALRAAGLRIHLETSGAYPLSGQFDWVALSPKRYKPPLKEIYAHVDELKVVIGEQADLEWATQIAQFVLPNTIRVLQPRWERTSGSKSLSVGECNSEAGQQLALDYVLSNPHWRIGLQTHKFLGVR